MNDGPKMLRYDVASQRFETVYDVTSQFGPNRKIRQMHSSNDDLVHSATLQAADSGEYLRLCGLFRSKTGVPLLFENWQIRGM